MVNAGKLLFKIPGQTSWCGFSEIEKEKPQPTTVICVKDLAVCRSKAGTSGERAGKIQYQFAKQKYAAC